MLVPPFFREVIIMSVRDIDCTINTPVTFGRKGRPIYGEDVQIYPTKPGRQDTAYFRKNYLEHLDPLESYDLVVVLISGGKDSVACFGQRDSKPGTDERKRKNPDRVRRKAGGVMPLHRRSSGACQYSDRTIPRDHS